MTGLVDGNAAAANQSATLLAPFSTTAGRPLGLTIWLAQSSASQAINIAARLRGLDVAIRVWDDSTSSMPFALNSSRDHVDDAAVNRVLRGGLAPGALRRVRDHIEDSLSERIDLSDLARLAGLSDCHFSRAFRQSVGVPPHRYVMTRRIEVAANLIKDTNRSLTDIALDVGFADHSHFTRTFARMLGETPGAYRRRHR